MRLIHSVPLAVFAGFFLAGCAVAQDRTTSGASGHTAHVAPTASPSQTPAISDDELRKYARVMVSLTPMIQSAGGVLNAEQMAQVEAIITQAGLTQARHAEISMAVQSDPALRTRMIGFLRELTAPPTS